MTETVSVEGESFVVEPGGTRRAFWARVSAGSWEPHTFAVFRRFLRPTHSCVDVGAWIGPTTLYAARRARWVHAIEPDPVAHAELVANVAANPALRERITLHRDCIAPLSGPIDLYAGGMYHGDSSAFGDSMSGIVPASDRPTQPSQRVQGVRLPDFMEANAIIDCGLIKVDVEGGEYSVIPGQWRELAIHGMPTSCISFHAPAAALRQELIGACIEELRSCYRWLYCASDRTITDLDRRVAAVQDWADESPDSPWRTLDRILGDGVVASNEEW